MLRVLHRLTALGLALIWLPVTLCCTAEAAVDGFSLCAEACADKTTDGKAADNCQIVEDGKYTASLTPIKVSAPVVFACASLPSDTVHAWPPPRAPEPSAGASGEPPDWIPGWQFERRAAAPVRAPDPLSA